MYMTALCLRLLICKTGIMRDKLLELAESSRSLQAAGGMWGAKGTNPKQSGPEGSSTCDTESLR